jgi:hypothetical protein
VIYVGVGLLNVASNIECVAGSLRNSEAEVESANGWDDTDADQSAPHLVDSVTAFTSAGGVRGCLVELALKSSGQADHDNSASKLTEALHGKDSSPSSMLDKS